MKQITRNVDMLLTDTLAYLSEDNVDGNELLIVLSDLKDTLESGHTQYAYILNKALNCAEREDFSECQDWLKDLWDIL
jgi:hypothetical protein